MASRAPKSVEPRAERLAYAALRIVAGGLFAFHGGQKILGWYGTLPLPAVASQIWIGGLIELIGGTLIAVGLFTRLTAFLASGQMAVAYFQFHWKFVVAQGMWLPALNKGELAVVYCFVFLYMAARGGGAFSLDALRGANGRPRD